MSVEPVVIVGIGGHGREVWDIVEADRDAGGRLQVIGFLDDDPMAHDLVSRRGGRLLGGSDRIGEISAAVLLGIGSGRHRDRLDKGVIATSLTAPCVAHPMASIGSEAILGPGTVLWAGARVSTNVQLGRHVHLNQNCAIGHDAVLEDYVSVNPGATVSGNVVIESGATIGTGANIVQGVHVGRNAVVGAGAVVINDIEPGTTVVGSPARPIDR